MANSKSLLSQKIPFAFVHVMFGSGVPAAIQSRNTEFNLTTSAFSGSITHLGGTEIIKKRIT